MRGKLKKIVALLMVMMLGATALTACGSKDSADGSKAPAGSKELTIYTGLPEAEVPVYIGAFEKETGIKVNYVRLSAGEMLTRIQTEKDHPNASVMHAVSWESFIQATDEGLLEPYQAPDLADVPEQYLDSHKTWDPIYMGVLCFGVNKDWFEKNNLEYPKSWEDLLNPAYKGQISMAHPSTSGTSYSIVALLVQMMGEDKAFEYLEKLDKNVRQYTKAGSASPMEVALGEAAIALTYTHDALKPANEGYPVGVVFPSEGTGYEVGGVAIIKGGPAEELENAKTFVDWCVSPKGQQALNEAKSNRIPINTKVSVPDGLQTVDELNVIDYDPIWSAENRTRLTEKFMNEIDNAASLKE